ncbi:hypothetical protein [Macrococcus carouselicus]|uniref:hypothetical protein n=1 Tax=Macrococcus carouselicus TaxID=69969 RepID=UPI001FB81EB3|nr:hypothetical protein [Macrococcus carouselicus]
MATPKFMSVNNMISIFSGMAIVAYLLLHQTNPGRVNMIGSKKNAVRFQERC